MSKGLGAIERAVLAALDSSDGEWVLSGILAYMVYDQIPTRSHKNSVNRAVNNLKKKGLVDVIASTGDSSKIKKIQF